MDSQILLKIITADAESHKYLLSKSTQQSNSSNASLKHHRQTHPATPSKQPLSSHLTLSHTASHLRSSLHRLKRRMWCVMRSAVGRGRVDHFPVDSDTSSWTYPPYSGTITSGRLHGRGTIDMKAGLAASIIAYTYLYKYRSHLSGSIALFAVSDEETGGKWGTKYLLEDERWRGDCMINAEPGGTGTIRFAEKGTLRLTFEVRTEGAHGAYTHLSETYIYPLLYTQLHPFEEVLIRALSGASATLLAAHLITTLHTTISSLVPNLTPSLVEYMSQPSVLSAIDAAMGPGASSIALKPTLNIGTIHGGLKVNMIPSYCVFEADIRMPIGLTRDDVLPLINEILKEYPNVSVQVQEAASHPAAGCAHDHPMVDILARSAVRVRGGHEDGKGDGDREMKKPVAIPSMGATDCKFYRYRGIPAYVFGVSPKGMAAKDESVDVQEFLDVVRTHALAAWEYLGGK
ncbi:acetylornithine deacetylase/succinyldiaminopimelate desuccinylase-like deacylase [Cadophora sp. MPI-SDFR-AT-0126]|nr:acetylornithine deacetylase/succinyldiaminopimelate desuccinylase-like deacylase [Leotiomycetes sp. MPI-SDFR-AT-0126]